MKVVVYILIVILVGGLAVLCVSQLIKLIRDIKAYRVRKKEEKNNASPSLDENVSKIDSKKED